MTRTIDPTHGEVRHGGLTRQDYERHGVHPTHCTCGAGLGYTRGGTMHPAGYYHAARESAHLELDHVPMPAVVEGGVTVAAIERLQPCERCA